MKDNFLVAAGLRPTWKKAPGRRPDLFQPDPPLVADAESGSENHTALPRPDRMASLNALSSL